MPSNLPGTFWGPQEVSQIRSSFFQFWAKLALIWRSNSTLLTAKLNPVVLLVTDDFGAKHACSRWLFLVLNFFEPGIIIITVYFMYYFKISLEYPTLNKSLYKLEYTRRAGCFDTFCFSGSDFSWLWSTENLPSWGQKSSWQRIFGETTSWLDNYCVLINFSDLDKAIRRNWTTIMIPVPRKTIQSQ